VRQPNAGEGPFSDSGVYTLSWC